MKTTLDLPDDLLIEAKSVAARRHTTLKAIVEHALRREIQQPSPSTPPIDDKFELNELGFLVLKRKPDEIVTLEDIKKIQDDIDQEEFNAALKFGGHQ
jgi:hypothetical protein